MEGRLKSGIILNSVSGNKYTVKNFLGAGTQGEVYSVSNGEKLYALKWYFKHMATPEQQAILENLITVNSPDESFLWPLDLIIHSRDVFGYIMELRPPEYRDIVDMLKRRAEPSFFNLCRFAYNLTKGYKRLHAIGYCYYDINFSNAFFNPSNGKALICDNDNVSVKNVHQCSVLGTPRFMAPEIVVGKAKPSRNTDLYSLAVLLFYMFMLNHPLDGKREADIKCMDIFAMEELYGKNPVFIFDPENNSNRPVKGIHDNATIYWDIYPQKLRDAFTTVFTNGLKNPTQRITENKWMEVLTSTMSHIIRCPSCGAEVFFDETKEETGEPHECWNCHGVVNVPMSITVDKHRVLLNKHTKIYAHQLFGNEDADTLYASVSVNPNNADLLGLKNETGDCWYYIKTDGTNIPIAPGRSAAIVKGAKVNFGQFIGEFK